MPPKPPRRPATAKPSPGDGPVGSFEIIRGVQERGAKVVIYGPGGVGKTELASLAAEANAGPVLFIDLEDGTDHLDVARVKVDDWSDMRTITADPTQLDGFGMVVIDSLTKAEELAVAFVVATVPHDTGGNVSSIEGFGFGKGYVHVYEQFVLLAADLDRIARSGIDVVLICHECVANVPNPEGVDWIRYEPRLQSPASGKSSIRHRVKEWADHVLFVSFDAVVSKDGKATGSGTRTTGTPGEVSTTGKPDPVQTRRRAIVGTTTDERR